MDRRRVVITGIGLLTPVGFTAKESWSAILNGKSGIGPITHFDASDLSTRIAGEVACFTPPPTLDGKRFRKMDRFAQLALVAAEEAIVDSGLQSGELSDDRKGVCLGTGVGGMKTFEEQSQLYLERGSTRISPFMIPQMMPNAASAAISIEYSLYGPAITLTSACASSSDAIIAACDLIRNSRLDAVVAGGAESTITPVGLSGFIAARTLSKENTSPTRASRPLDRSRDGFVLSEGACILVLEEFVSARRRGAKIYAEIVGGGQSSDSYHITAPKPDGSGAARAMRSALSDARRSIADIDYINAHATSTILGDLAEVEAIQSVFGSHCSNLSVNASKSLIGHTLGASGAIAVAITALSIRDKIVHGTLNLENPEVKCNFKHLSQENRSASISNAIVNSFGFGGHNACVVLSSID